MNSFIKYPLVLGIVTALSGVALFGTYKGTKKGIERQEKAAKVKALKKIFTSGYGAVEEVEKEVDGEKITFSKVWKTEEKNGKPDYYVTTGKGIGYNTAVPITILAGFRSTKKNGKGRILLGWSVIKSEETPGLGEKAKEEAAPYTIAEIVTGNADKKESDRRTDFQKQFYNPEKGKTYTASELKISKNGGDIDIITGATFSTQGIISAIKNANNKLEKALN